MFLLIQREKNPVFYRHVSLSNCIPESIIEVL